MSDDDATPGPPRGLRTGGRKLWRSVVGAYELEEHELTLLREACRVTDRLDMLAALVERDGITEPGTGQVHPAVKEARQQEITLARLLAALRMPAGEDGDQQATARPQRRGGARGAYGIRGVVS